VTGSDSPGTWKGCTDYGKGYAGFMCENFINISNSLSVGVTSFSKAKQGEAYNVYNIGHDPDISLANRYI
jgi:hypothetical protein